MNDRNMASFAITPQLIKEALHMPEGHKIVGAEWDFASRNLRLFIEGPDLAVVKPGEMVPNITPEISVHYDPDSKIREYKWRWGISS